MPPGPPGRHWPDFSTAGLRPCCPARAPSRTRLQPVVHPHDTRPGPVTDRAPSQHESRATNFGRHQLVRGCFMDRPERAPTLPVLDSDQSLGIAHPAALTLHATSCESRPSLTCPMPDALCSKKHPGDSRAQVSTCRLTLRSPEASTASHPGEIPQE